MLTINIAFFRPIGSVTQPDNILPISLKRYEILPVSEYENSRKIKQNFELGEFFSDIYLAMMLGRQLYGVSRSDYFLY